MVIPSQGRSTARRMPSHSMTRLTAGPEDAHRQASESGLLLAPRACRPAVRRRHDAVARGSPGLNISVLFTPSRMAEPAWADGVESVATNAGTVIVKRKS
jgi:hypothetical protein